MLVMTIILAFMLDPGFPLTDEDQDFYTPRPIELIEEEPSLEDVEYEFHYRQMREQLDRMLHPNTGSDK